MRRTSVRSAAARDYYDYNLLAAVILLTCFGLVMLYSTSAYEAAREYGSDTYYFKKQALISLGGRWATPSKAPCEAGSLCREPH